jgi:hypothetical protein
MKLLWQDEQGPTLEEGPSFYMAETTTVIEEETMEKNCDEPEQCATAFQSGQGFAIAPEKR